MDLGVGIEWEGRRVSKPHHGLMYRDVDETGGGGVDEHGRLIGPNGLGLESDVGLPDGEVRRLRFESVTKGLGRPNDKETTTAVDMSVPGAGWATGAATVEEKSEPAATAATAAAATATVAATVSQQLCQPGKAQGGITGRDQIPRSGNPSL